MTKRRPTLISTIILLAGLLPLIGLTAARWGGRADSVAPSAGAARAVEDHSSARHAHDQLLRFDGEIEARGGGVFLRLRSQEPGDEMLVAVSLDVIGKDRKPVRARTRRPIERLALDGGAHVPVLRAGELVDGIYKLHVQVAGLGARLADTGGGALWLTSYLRVARGSAVQIPEEQWINEAGDVELL